jgi:hypothetical protein
MSGLIGRAPPRLNDAGQTKLRVEQLEDRATPAVIHVTNTNDGGAGSLRAAIAEANGTVAADDIVFDVNGTITLTEPLDTITHEVTIIGNGMANTIIERSNAAQTPSFRIFTIAGSVNKTITIKDLTVRKGRVTGAGDIGLGGGIAHLNIQAQVTSPTLTLNGVKVDNCFAEGGGGGVYSVNTLDMIDCKILENESHGNGAGIRLETFFTSIKTSEIKNNTTTGNGGGIYARPGIDPNGENPAKKIGELKIKDSQINQNTVTGDGGGLYLTVDDAGTDKKFAATVTGSTTTINTNTAGGKGAAVWSDGNASFTDTVMDQNTGGRGDGYAVHNAAKRRAINFALDLMVLDNCRIRQNVFNGSTPRADAAAVYTSDVAARVQDIPILFKNTHVTGIGNNGHGVFGIVRSGLGNVIDLSIDTSTGWVTDPDVTNRDAVN